MSTLVIIAKSQKFCIILSNIINMFKFKIKTYQTFPINFSKYEIIHHYFKKTYNIIKISCFKRRKKEI